MAGIGVRLNKIYGKNTLTTDLVGVGYSTVVTIAPMLVVIGAIVAMEYFLGFSRIGYRERELFCSIISKPPYLRAYPCPYFIFLSFHF